MDVAEPPRIVVESGASCADAEQIETLLRAALDESRAPGHAWTVKMSVHEWPASTSSPQSVRAVVRTLRAEGQIADGEGVQVAQRILSVPAGDCRGLARAVGVWASLVLEQELSRERAADAAAAPAKATDLQSAPAPWPAPMPVEPPPPEGDWYLHHNDSRDVELGVAGFLMTGAGAGAMAGASPYAIIEAGNGIFLRPSLSVGEPLPALNTPPVVHALWLAGRFDTCLRLPGLYTRNRGMQLDMCGGADIGVLDDATDDATIPYVSLGPSLDLRGELGSLLSATLRAVAGVNVTSETRGALVQPLWSGRLELAFSWKVK